MIQQIFEVDDRSCEMLQCKQKSLIIDTTANKKLSTVVDKDVNNNKRGDTATDKKLNAAADKAIDADKN